MRDFAVEVKDLSYAFKEDLVLKNINLNLEPNKIYGLLGKNGAGKTTLLNLLVKGLLLKEGEIRLFDEPLKETDEVLEKVCIVREGEFYSKEMKIKEIMNLYASFYEGYDKSLEEKLAAHFNVPLKKAYGKCSRGMKSMVFNIIALCSNAPLTILDEPTLGLDAEVREQFYEILLETYSQRPRTMIISTHLIEEIENLLEEVIILHKGEVLLKENVEELRSKACYLTGKEEALDSLTILKDKAPKKSFGKMKVYSYYGEIPDEDLQQIEEWHIEMTPMSLQKAFIELTREEVSENA